MNVPLKKAVRLLALPVALFGQTANSPWTGYARDAQHSALSTVPAQPLNRIHWSTPVDLSFDLSSASGPLYIHYGSPSITTANTVLVPVKTGATGGFEVRAINGASGVILYTLPTDYSLPTHNWTPPYSPILSQVKEVLPPMGHRIGPLASPVHTRQLRERLYYAGAGGTVYFRDRLDSPLGSNGVAGATGQIAFYGTALYSANAAAFNASVQISTPLVADRSGNIYFGFIAASPNPANMSSGLARVSASGVGSWVSAASTAGGDASIVQVALNCAPALSDDGSVLYFAVSDGNEFGTGYLVSINSATLAPISFVRLMDPRGGLATVSTDSSASPMIGPDGDIYYGVLETNCCSSHNDRGWLLHFDATLAETKIPGSFGWDDTASIVPPVAVPSYVGKSSYLILTKYNNYADTGTGNGVNKIAVLDPGNSQPDEYSNSAVAVMSEVITITGVTPDPQPGFPNAVKEWCINTAAIDPFTKSAIVNSEDGLVYRWDFTSNTFTQSVRLTGGIGEAYTPTLIGPDGTAYAVNDAVLFAVGQ